MLSMESCPLFHLICESCMAVGGLGTVGTLICMIRDSKRKTKQIKTIQQIQSHQLESLYEPDIRINSYGNITNNLVVRNYGENLIILGIHEVSDSSLLNKEGMKTWFPFHFDKNSEINIPLLMPPTKIRAFRMQIQYRNRLGIVYTSYIEITNGKPLIKSPSNNFY